MVSVNFSSKLHFRLGLPRSLLKNSKKLAKTTRKVEETVEMLNCYLIGGEQRQRGEGFSGWKWSIFRAIESISEMIGGKCLKRKWRFSAEEETDGATHNNNNKKWKHK